MKSVYMIRTRDGELHPDFETATRHVNKQYGQKLSSLAHKVAVQGDGKYKLTQEFIDENLSLFVELHEIRQDLILDESEEE